MPLRRRLTLAAAGAVAVAVVLVAVVCYFAVRGSLRGDVDHQLRSIAAGPTRRIPPGLGGRFGDPRGFPAQPGPRQGGPGVYFTLIAPDGSALAPNDQILRLPVDATDRAIAEGSGATALRDKTVDGVRLRVITFPLERGVGGAVQAARSIESIEHTLDRLRIVLLLACLGGVGLAVVLGRLVGRGLVAPIVEVAEAARHIGETEDLGRRIVVRSPDEVGELAWRFNTMLDRLESSRSALDDSVRSQRQLVADASHELRTPITSLRTNIEVLLEGGELDATSRERLLDDVREQIEELGALVADLIALARGDAQQEEPEDVRLDDLAREAVARARRHANGVHFDLRAERVWVEGVPERLGRALNNLLDNAARHSPPEGTVEVAVDIGGVTVRDHGDGVADEDLPHLFDRFYRGAAARGRVGTGLGLAIVRQVAEAHGGTVSAANAEGGGAVFRLELPGRPPTG